MNEYVEQMKWNEDRKKVNEMNVDLKQDERVIMVRSVGRQ